MAASTATDDKQAQTAASTGSNRTDDDRQRQIEAQRDEATRQFERYERDLIDARQAGDEAIDRVVIAWADAFALLVPRAVLRPIEAIDVLFGAVEQVLDMQRRMINELLGTARRYAAAADNRDGSMREWSNNGAGAPHEVRSPRGTLVV